MTGHHVDGLDPDSFTRGQLLTERGYPAEVIAGNGNAAKQVEHIDPEPVETHPCQGCGAPIENPGHRFCSPACRGRAAARSPRPRASTPMKLLAALGQEAIIEGMRFRIGETLYELTIVPEVTE